jgi:hypothetical protein
MLPALEAPAFLGLILPGELALLLGGVLPTRTASHCWARVHQAGLLDHYERVQDQEANLRQAREWAWAAHRYAIWALGSSGIGILVAAAALLTR